MWLCCVVSAFNTLISEIAETGTKCVWVMKWCCSTTYILQESCWTDVHNGRPGQWNNLSSFGHVCRNTLRKTTMLSCVQNKQLHAIFFLQWVTKSTVREPREQDDMYSVPTMSQKCCSASQLLYSLTEEMCVLTMVPLPTNSTEQPPGWPNQRTSRQIGKGWAKQMSF